MAKLIPSLDLIRRTVNAETAYTLSRLQVLERLPGNPVGVAHRQLDDGAVAFMARHLPVPSFNSVVGLRAGHEHHLEPLVRWYRDNGVNPQFAMVPGLSDAKLGRELARLGYYQSEFHTAVFCEPDLPLADAGAIAIETVTTAGLLGEFLDAHAAGWQIPDPQGFKANVRGWLGLPGWSLYLARVDGRPAATGILYVHHRVAYCADAATDPAFRRRGLQTAMLRQRIADAGAAGADFVCSGAAYLSTSHRNMERVGMRVQFVRAVWTEGVSARGSDPSAREES
jgi:ribosomal protein S18 acetylase RimI-like enzyme